MNKNLLKPNYRFGILAIIFNEAKEFLIVQLVGYKENDWNWVGGGKEGDETVEENLARELKEELGQDKAKFEVISKSSYVVQYDFPGEFVKENPIDPESPYTGQRKEIFLVKFIGNKEEIKIQPDEIRNLKWVAFEELKDHLIFPDQYQNFLKVYEEFKYILR